MRQCVVVHEGRSLMEQMAAVVLAAGEGKRMKSNKSKVVHEILGLPLVKWVCNSINQAGIKECILVVGHKQEQVRESLGDTVKYTVQQQQLGTGHAVIQAKEFLQNREGLVFVLCGDTPLISSQTISKVMEYHNLNSYSATVVTADMEDPTGYGRIVRGQSREVLKIVEHKDANEIELKIPEVNSGMYCFSNKLLLEALEDLDNKNSQGEYYLTDTLEILIKKGYKVGAYKISDRNEILGINDRLQLAEATGILRQRILEKHMKEGVTIIDPSNTYIGAEVKIGIDTIIYPGTHLEGKTIIGEDCIIGPDSRIVSSTLGNKVEFANSIIFESSIANKTHVGPFAYIRPGSNIGEDVKIGDFVEVKKSLIGDRTKISHLTYIGDAEIGKNVNIACGVVTVNYDGKNKHKTKVGDNSFIGCNVNLVAPVEVKNNAYIAAGSTITDEVPEYSLAIARERQTIKEDWVVIKDMVRKDK